MSGNVNAMNRKAASSPNWLQPAMWIAGALAVSLFVIIYGAYGDSHAPQSQKTYRPRKRTV